MTCCADGLRRPAVYLLSAALVLGLLTTPAYAETTPWDFFREGIAQADSLPQRAGVVFFTIVLFWLSLGRWRMLLPVVLVAIVALAVRKPEVRGSRVVQAGLVVLFLGLAPLLLAALLGADNAVGLGFLFAFSVPVGLVIIGAGATLALLRGVV